MCVQVLLVQTKKNKNVWNPKSSCVPMKECYKPLSFILNLLTLTLPSPSAGVSGSLDSYCSLKPLCSGMGEVVPARTSQKIPPPSPRTVL